MLGEFYDGGRQGGLADAGATVPGMAAAEDVGVSAIGGKGGRAIEDDGIEVFGEHLGAGELAGGAVLYGKADEHLIGSTASELGEYVVGALKLQGEGLVGLADLVQLTVSGSIVTNRSGHDDAIGAIEVLDGGLGHLGG